MYQLLSWNFFLAAHPSPAETDAGPMGDERSIQVSGQQGNRDEVRNSRHFEGVEGGWRKQICLSVYLKQYCCERKYTWLRTMKHGQSLLEGKWSETLVKRLIFHFHDCFKASEIHEHFSWCFTLCRMVSRSLSFVKGTTQSFWSSSCNQPNAMRSQVRF